MWVTLLDGDPGRSGGQKLPPCRVTALVQAAAALTSTVMKCGFPRARSGCLLVFIERLIAEELQKQQLPL